MRMRRTSSGLWVPDRVRRMSPLRFRNSVAIDGQMKIFPPKGSLGLTGIAPALSVGGGGGGGFAISGTSGTLSHNSSVTISGAGFGTKSTAAPKVYDDASGSNPLATGWSTAWPDGINSTYNMAYRTLPVTNGSVSTLPHSHVSKAICGCHNGSGANAGQSVALHYDRANFDAGGYPQYTFCSYWERTDNNFPFGDQDNYKVYDWSEGTGGGYNLPYNWYIEYYNLTGNTQPEAGIWNLNDDDEDGAYVLECVNNGSGPDHDLDQNGHNANWDEENSPLVAWKKVEIAIKLTTDHTGYVKVWDNGVLVMDYLGQTDGGTMTTLSNKRPSWDTGDRQDMIGGYSGNRGSSAWRYWCDVYYDQTLSRVILGNASTLGACTKKEMQVPSAWADGSITVTMKHGAIPTGSAWLYVYKADGTPTAGFAVTLV